MRTKNWGIWEHRIEVYENKELRYIRTKNWGISELRIEEWKTKNR